VSKLDKLVQRRSEIHGERKREGSYTSDIIERFNSPSFDPANAPLPGATLIKVNIDDIESSPVEWNFFADQSEDHVMNLAVSLKSEGQFSPIIIREITSDMKKWQCLAGHTRIRAARYLKSEGYNEYQHLYAFAYPLNTCSDIQARRIIVHSNTEQRHSLSAEEKQACFYFQYCDEANNDRNQSARAIMEKLMDRYSIKRSQAYNLRSIGEKLIPAFSDMLQAGNITIRNAISLARIEKDLQQWIIDTYKDQLNRDIIPKLLGKNREEIATIFSNRSNNDHNIQKYIEPQFFKKVHGGSLAKVYVVEGTENEFLELVNKYYAENGL
jgi:hypothetical protein